MQTRISILDREIGEGLCEYLLQHPFGLQPVLCRSWTELLAAQAPISLIGRDFWSEMEVQTAQAKGMLLLELGEPELSPYQPADCLIREIYRRALQQHLELGGSGRLLYDKTRVVGVCSPHGYDLQTGFAFIYGLLHAQETRTLYLDLTYYNGFFDASAEDVGDLFYELHKHSRPIGAILSSMTQRFGQMDYIPPVRTQMDLEDLEEKELTELLHLIMQEGAYGLIVLNLPVRPSLLRAVYDCSSCMYSLQREGALFDRAQTRLMDEFQEEADAPKILRIVRMPPVSGSFSLDETMYEQLLFGEMAAFVKRVDAACPERR